MVCDSPPPDLPLFSGQRHTRSLHTLRPPSQKIRHFGGRRITVAQVVASRPLWASDRVHLHLRLQLEALRKHARERELTIRLDPNQADVAAEDVIDRRSRERILVSDLGGIVALQDAIESIDRYLLRVLARLGFFAVMQMEEIWAHVATIASDSSACRDDCPRAEPG